MHRGGWKKREEKKKMSCYSHIIYYQPPHDLS